MMMPQQNPANDFGPTAAMEILELRARLLDRTRSFFADRGFLEVDTPLLSADTVVDRHLDPFAVKVPGESAPRWLQTSPEFAMKRLLTSFPRPIYQICKAFRQDEAGPLHNPEFTMVEWYVPGDDMQAGIRLLSDLAEALLARGSAEPISYADAFAKFVGIDPHTTTVEILADAARSRCSAVPDSMDADDRDGWLDLLLVELVQPQLGIGRPAILYDYPASQAALAEVRPDDPPVAERFELYCDGIELANGYHEMTDPAALRERNRKVNRQRRDDGKPELPEESRLLAAMEQGMPRSAGCALGFDRVVMLAARCESIRQVIAFPFDRS